MVMGRLSLVQKQVLKRKPRPASLVCSHGLLRGRSQSLLWLADVHCGPQERDRAHSWGVVVGLEAGWEHHCGHVA